MSLDKIGEAAFADFFIEKALLSLEVIACLGVVREELLRLLNDSFKLTKTVTLLNFAHRLPLKELDFVADLCEEFLDEDGRTLFD